MRGRRHATHRTSACVQAIPAVTLPEERWTGAPVFPLRVCTRDSQRPAFLMPTAEADSPRAVAGRPSAPAQEAQVVGLVGPGKPGPRREFLRISHMRLDASAPWRMTRRLERNCLHRSLRLWHRRVALRAVGLKRKKKERKTSHKLWKFWQALKYQIAAQAVLGPWLPKWRTHSQSEP